jgi:hypothetical protein
MAGADDDDRPGAWHGASVEAGIVGEAREVVSW